jgi:peptidoglycan biosynthesis protein MviN/MurJ (putative lipid II flippase)
MTAILNALLLWSFIGRRLESKGVSSPGADLARGAFAYLAAALLMGGTVYLADSLLIGPAFSGDSLILKGSRVGLGIGIGLLSYLGVSICFGLQETLEMLDLIKRRWGRGKR